MLTPKQFATTVALGLALQALSSPDASAARAITIDQARTATIREARTPGTFTEQNLPVGMPEVPRRWEVYGGFCHRQPYVGRRVVNCWAMIVFPDWPGCRIFDLYRVRRIGQRVDARQLGQWTSDSLDCPGFGSYTIEPVDGEPQVQP